MKYTIPLFILQMLLLTGCVKPETYCGVKDPLNDIAWLKDEIKGNPTNLMIYKQTYKSTEGFYLYYCIDSACKVTSAAYKTCENTLLYYSSSGIVPSTFPNDFNVQSSYRELIYP